MLPLGLGFKINRKLNFYSNISLFLFKVTLKTHIGVSKFQFSFFTKIEDTKQGTLKIDFN